MKPIVRLPHVFPRPAALATLALAVLICLRWRFGANADTSWLITVSERVLDGQTLYVDILETNPPASVWLYLPLVWLARMVAVPPEWVVDVGFALAALAATGFSLRLARGLPGDAAQRRALLLASLGVVLLILPAMTYSQREHAALIAMIPVLFGLARRLAGLGIGPAASVALGLCAGLSMAIKPHFALALLLPACFVAWRERSFAIAGSPTALVAMACFSAYAAAVFLVTPAFVHDVAPLVAKTYLPLRDITAAATGAIALVWLGLFALAVSARREGDDLWAVAVLAGCGFFGAAVIQGKGWSYHFLPAIGCLSIAVALGASRFGPVARLAAMGLFIFAFIGLAQGVDRVRIDAALAGRPGLRVAALKSDIALAHPLVRRIGGVYVQSVCSNWIAASALPRLLRAGLDGAERRDLEAAVARERAILRDDLRRGQPDVILRFAAEFDWLAFAREDAETARLLDDYESAGIVEGVEILRRRQS